MKHKVVDVLFTINKSGIRVEEADIQNLVSKLDDMECLNDFKFFLESDKIDVLTEGETRWKPTKYRNETVYSGKCYPHGEKYPVLAYFYFVGVSDE